MDGIKIDVTGNIARVIEKPKRITSGTVGLPVEFTFDGEWAGLGKTAVFMAGCENIIVDGVETSAIVPWEVLRRPGVRLSIGVFGVNADGSVAIPTVYATVGPVCQGAEPGHTTSVEPKLPIWKQLLNMIGNLLGLKTNAKDNLVDAINEVHDKVDSMQPGKSPQNYILTGIFDQDDKVRLPDYNWDELVAAIKAENYVAIRLSDTDGLWCFEYVLQEYSAEEGFAAFSCASHEGVRTIDVFSNGETFYGYQLNKDIFVSFKEARVLSDEEQNRARNNIGAAPKSYILHGTIESGGGVTLTNFNWDELVAAITSEENIYVAARLGDAYGEYYYELPYNEYSTGEDEEARVKFMAHIDLDTYRAITVYPDGTTSFDYISTPHEVWVFTLEDGSTVRKVVAAQ